MPLQNYCPHLFSDRWGAACGVDVLTYTSFEQPSVITESPFQATFAYNTEGQRALMTVSVNGGTILTRWYAGRYIRETAGSWIFR